MIRSSVGSGLFSSSSTYWQSSVSTYRRWSSSVRDMNALDRQ